MKNKIFNDIITGLKQAVDYERKKKMKKPYFIMLNTYDGVTALTALTVMDEENNISLKLMVMKYSVWEKDHE